MAQQLLGVLASLPGELGPAQHTGQTYDVVEKACDRDNFMSAEEAKAFGLVDEVVKSRKELPNMPEKTSVQA